MATQYPEELLERLTKSFKEADVVLEMFRTASENNFFASLVRVVTIDSEAELLGLGKLTRKALAFATQIEFYLEFKWDHEDFFRKFLTERELILAEWNANQRYFNWFTEPKEVAIADSILGLYLDFANPAHWTNEVISAYSESMVQKAISDSPLLGCQLIEDYARKRIQGWKRHLPFKKFERDCRGTNWLRSAAATGNAAANRELAHRYDSGDGISRDHVRAAELYSLAAEKGDSEAQHMLAHYYANGIGVGRDAAEAVRLYRLSAAQGNPRSKFNLASHLRQGIGVQQNFDEAFYWLNSSSHSGSLRILGELGIYHSNGWGTKVDKEMAIELFKKAARFDHVSRYNLALEYLYRDGNKDDKIEAFKWIQLAILGRGNKELPKFAYETRDDLKNELNPDQLADARARIENQLREWK